MSNKNRTSESIGQIQDAWQVLVFSKYKIFIDSFINCINHKTINGFQINFEYFAQLSHFFNELQHINNKTIIHLNLSDLSETEVTTIVDHIRTTDVHNRIYLVVWTQNPWMDLSVGFLQSGKINDFRSMSNLAANRLTNIIYTNIKNHEQFIELERFKSQLETTIAQRTEKLELAFKKNASVNAKLLKNQNQIDKQNQEIFTRNSELELAFKKSSKQSIKLQKALLQNEQQRRFLEEALEEIQSKNDTLVAQNEEIVAQRDHIEQQHEEIQSQRDMALKQRDKIMEQQQEIQDNIMYASRIQYALLPPKDLIKQLLPKHFILNKPKDVVSGDFYWISQNRGKTIIAVSDCTGHGISGAMMSMLGTAFLNEIVNRNDITNSTQILQQLRERVISSLHQQIGDTIEDSRDGMDIAICIIDIVDNTLEFSGANNPLYLFRKGELIELKPDKMPIGIHEFFHEPFNTQTIDLQKGDTIYLFSDGYADQFGGKHGKKLKYAKFKSMLSDLSSVPFIKRQATLLKEFELWRGHNEQIDDVLIVGFEIL
jgi:serine phosphatase RsbU (regulator of sigma subunit)